MRLTASIFLLLLMACGQKKAPEKESNPASDTLPTADTLTSINKPGADLMFQPTQLETELNGLLKEKFGGTLVVVNDTIAKWPKDEFDYFIGPKRKDHPDYPYITKGDFNGDGKEDAAALVKDSGTGSYQVAVIFGSPLDINRISFWKEDIDLCAVSTYPKGPLEGMGTGKVTMKGDGIDIEFYERASFVLYWNGTAFKRAQTGD